MRSITFLGHSSFKMVLGNVVILINPAVSESIGQNRRLIKSPLDPKAVKECDIILISNERPGNCEPETVKEISERCYSKVIAPEPALSMLDIPGRLKIGAHPGDRISVKGIEIEVKRAIHPQSAQPVGFLIRGEGLAIYHAGDTYSFSEMARIRCDVAIVPIGGGAVMDPFAANSIVKEMRPKVAIPMHYNTYERIMQDARDFTSDLGENIRGIALSVGQELRI